MSNFEEYEVKFKNGEVKLLSEIMKSHKAWLDSNGKVGERADLTDTFICVDFPDDTDFTDAILVRTEFVDVNMTFACFRNTNCYQAEFRRCYLREGCFLESDLSQCNFRNTVIKSADFYNCNLTDSVFHDCDLKNTHCDGSSFKNASFIDTRIHCVNFSEALNVPNLPMACPSEGSFIAWKKVRNNNSDRVYLIKLKIPEDAVRLSATSKKCRCDKALVLGIYDHNKRLLPLDKVVNKNYTTTIYEVGLYVFPDDFDPDRWHECSHGIHFFVDFEDAKNYMI